MSEIKLKKTLNSKLYGKYRDVFDDYSEVIGEAMKVMVENVGKNGRQSYDIENFEKDLKLVWAKVQRKFERVEKITFDFEELESMGHSKIELLEYLRDGYFDSINYNIMAVILIDKYIKKTKERDE